MSRFLYLKELAFLAGLVVSMTVLAAACGGGNPEEVEIAVSLQDKQLTPGTIRVGQNDTVTLKIETDTRGSLHLHGYDIEQEVAPGEVTDFVFVADATGRYRIAFHPAASGGHGRGGSGDSHGEMSHNALASKTPIGVSVGAEPDGLGGVNVNVMTESWRWAPEEVNLANSPGAGHGHIYVDGVKLNRVYGPHYYLMGLEPGMREIRVTLNASGHNDLTYDGRPVEAAAVVTLEGDGRTGHPDPSAVDAEAAMSVEVMAHPDPLGGYNLEVVPTGFEFTPQNVDGGHVPGEGIGYVSIDGKTHARLYTPWLKLPDLEPGTHEITVALANNQGQPYRWQGNPAQASVTVHTEAKEQSEGSDHHGLSEADGEETKDHDSVGQAGGEEKKDHDSMEQGDGQQEMDHGSTEQDRGDGGETPAAEAEYDVGYLEVQPR